LLFKKRILLCSNFLSKFSSTWLPPFFFFFFFVLAHFSIQPRVKVWNVQEAREIRRIRALRQRHSLRRSIASIYNVPYFLFVYASAADSLHLYFVNGGKAKEKWSGKFEDTVKKAPPVADNPELTKVAATPEDPLTALPHSMLLSFMTIRRACVAKRHKPGEENLTAPFGGFAVAAQEDAAGFGGEGARCSLTLF
jgi:hypothetical protein